MHDQRAHMSNRTTMASVLTGAGMAAVVAAVLVAAIGAGGLGYMHVNPEAVQLVAGCALCSAVLIGLGIILITCGLTRMTVGECDPAPDSTYDAPHPAEAKQTRSLSPRALPTSLTTRRAP